MKTITLKLTLQEDKSLYRVMLKDAEGFRKFASLSSIADSKCYVEIRDVDKFREFLNNEIADVKGNLPKSVLNVRLYKINRGDYENLKSILSKLDQAVDKNDDDGVADGLELDSETNYLNNNDEPKSYSQKVNEEIECIKFEQKQYHGDLDILKEGFIDSEYNDDVWCEKEWDGLGITYESVRQCKCSDCGKSVSELELRLFRKHSKVDEDLCKDCHSKSTANLSMKEMAELVMEYLPCQKDNDIIYTLEHQFKTRGDLAFILMAVSKNKYQVRDDIWS